MSAAIQQALTDARPVDWPEAEPLPDGLPDVPTIDEALLPATLKPWVMDIAERVSCPPDFPAVGAMVSLAAVVGRQIAIRPQRQDDWTVVPNLWGAIVGRPGLLKTPALAEMLKPLYRLEVEAREQFEQAVKEHEADKMVSAQARKHAEAEVKKAVRAGNRARAGELALSALQDEQEPPTRRRYVTQDATPEMLGALLASNPRGLLVFRDELTGWFANLEREGNESARAFYLEAWNGTGRFTFDRIGRGTVDIESATVSVLGGIQPGPLAAYVRQTMGNTKGDDGLLQRLQVVSWPDAPKDWRNVDRWPDSDARNEAHTLWQRLDEIRPEQIGADTDARLPFLRFDDEAQDAWCEWRERLETRLRAGNEAPAFESALSKQRSLVPSIALLIHLADNPEGGPVTLRAALQAMAWAEYLEDHARRLYAPALFPEAQAAKALGARIQAGELPATFSARDVYRKGWTGLDRAAVDMALPYLIESGWLQCRDVETGGRPSLAYDINPGCRR
ncbi:YfjI family protein [Wenzhouxiangella marina]|nr:YfjI family protein [Wenzhouxiangella marina]MBB6087388.1 putative DNA primase/helicase [Wenzhouxiangella marina]